MKTALMVRVKSYETPFGVTREPIIQIEDGFFGITVAPVNLTLIEKYAFDLFSCSFRGEEEVFDNDYDDELNSSSESLVVALHVLIRCKGIVERYDTRLSGRRLPSRSMLGLKSLLFKCLDTELSIPVEFVKQAALFHGASIAALSRLNRELRLVGGAS